MSSCDQIVLCDGQRRLLLARARRASGEHRDVLRAQIVLAAADGASNAAIGRTLGVTDDTVGSGGAGSAGTAWTDLVIGPAPVGPAASRRRSWPK